MSGSQAAQALGERQYATLVLRFLLDRRGRLVRCEVVGPDGRTHGRFTAWSDLRRTVRAALARER